MCSASATFYAGYSHGLNNATIAWGYIMRYYKLSKEIKERIARVMRSEKLPKTVGSIRFGVPTSTIKRILDEIPEDRNENMERQKI